VSLTKFDLSLATEKGVFIQLVNTLSSNRDTRQLEQDEYCVQRWSDSQENKNAKHILEWVVLGRISIILVSYSSYNTRRGLLTRYFIANLQSNPKVKIE
jgi:hypothetical protein